MKEYQSEAIVITAVNFGDSDQIVTAFSDNSGIIKLIVKGSRRQRRGSPPPLSPLAEGEFLYTEGRSELMTCREVSRLNFHLGLREDYATLTAASAMLLAIKASQMSHKPAPLLHELLRRYLAALPKAQAPATLTTSFKLKVCRHEGLYPLQQCCASCGETLSDLQLCDMGTFCKTHAPEHAIALDSDEAQVIHYLCHCRKIEPLLELVLPDTLIAKAELLFEQLAINPPIAGQQRGCLKR